MVATANNFSVSSNDLALTQGVPVANVRRSTFPDSLFVNVPAVPIFAEHTTTCTSGRYQGRVLTFGHSELLAVAQRCNQRIAMTGDYATLCLGHTPPKEMVLKGEAEPPEVVGMAGPFYMGQLVAGDGTRRWAILADFHYFREDYPRMKKYPRRSPELWLEERYADMFLDPIALLGSEAPRLDMGMVYSRFQAGRVVELYSAAAAPSASNVFVENHDSIGSHYAAEDHNSGGNAMLAPEDLKAITDAFMQTEPMQWVVSQMQQGGSPGGQAPGANPPPDAGGAPPQQNAGVDPMMAGGAAPMPMPIPAPTGAAPIPGQQPPPQNPQQYAGDDDDEDEFVEDGTDMEDDEDEPPKQYAGRDGKRRRKVSGKSNPRMNYEGNDVQGVEGQAPAPGKVMNSEGQAAGAGSVQGSEKYAKQFATMAKRIQALEGQVELERYGKENAQRLATIEGLKLEGYVVDSAKLMKRCSADRMNREMFAETVEDIRENYSKVPDGQLAIPDMPFPETEKSWVSKEGRPEVAQYSRAISDKAMAICQAKMNSNETVDYGTILEAVAKGQM